MLNKVGRDIPTNIPALEGREVYQGEFAIEPKAHRAGKPVILLLLAYVQNRQKRLSH